MIIKRWAHSGRLNELKAFAPEKILVLDTETTGLHADENDELLQVSFVRGDGEVLFDSYIRPEHKKSWADAEKVNGISPEMVKHAPKITDVADELQKHIESAELIIGYNLKFDLTFLVAAGILPNGNAEFFDVMLEYAVYRGVWNEKRFDWKWFKLIECAAEFGYEFQAHDSLEDTKATLHCFRSLTINPDYLTLVAHNPGEETRAEKISNRKNAKIGIITCIAVWFISVILFLIGLNANELLSGFGFIFGLGTIPVFIAQVVKYKKNAT